MARPNTAAQSIADMDGEPLYRAEALILRVVTGSDGLAQASGPESLIV
jgi:hypothetical protein